MESLVGYGSEDEPDEPTHRKKSMFRQADINYDEVQMDLSEDSSNSPKPNSHQRYSGSKDTNSYTKNKDDRSRRGDKYSPKYEKTSQSESKSRDKYRNDDRSDSRNQRYTDEKHKDYRSRDDKDRYKDDRSKEYSRKDSYDNDDKYKESRSYDSRDSNSRDNKKYSRESDRDRYYDSRDTGSRNSKSYDSRDSKSYDSRDTTKSRKFSSPSRHRSRSPAYSDSRAGRSNSKEKGRSSYSSKYYDRSASKMDRLEKLGIEIGVSSERASTSSYTPVDTKDTEKDRFYMPGITGRFTEQIQRRKLLWQKKEAPNIVVTQSQPTPLGKPGKVWQNTTFAQDTDGKVANKFKRLMGIKGAGGTTAPAKPATEILKKQEEMFSSMEAQYEVARTATHTMRGVGLGFGSFQR